MSVDPAAPPVGGEAGADNASNVVLLHGFAGDPSVWEDVPFAGEALALPGHGGGTVQPTWEANLDAVAARLHGCEAIVGYSLGARVALGLVATDRCARAILIGVTPGISDAERATRRAHDASWARMLREHGLETFADAWTAQPLFASQQRFSARSAARRAARLRRDPEQLARSLEAMGLAEMPDYTAALRDPRVSLVAGALDAKYIAIARAHGVAITLIPDSGHDPTLEQPALLAAQLSNFLRT